MSRIDVNYLDRPNKSLVRHKIFHIIEETFHPKHEHSERLSFITFSGYRFIDSIEFYERFNIRNIYSIEWESRRYKRAKFNSPYSFVDISKGTIKDFIDEKFSLVSNTWKVVYLDYESRLTDNILSDVGALFSSGFFDKKSLLFIAFNRGFDKAKLETNVKNIVPDKIDNPDAFKLWLSREFSNFVLNKMLRKYGGQKQLAEVLKVFYHDTSNMVVFGYRISDRETEDTIITIDPENFSLPALTFLEANYINNNLESDTNQIADRLGLKEKDVKIYLRYC